MGREYSLWNKFGTAVATAALGVISDQYNQAGLLVKSFWVYNSGPGVLTAGSLETSPDGNMWIGYDGTTFQTLGSAIMKRVLIQNDCAPFWRFQAMVGSSTATLSYYWNF